LRRLARALPSRPGAASVHFSLAPRLSRAMMRSAQEALQHRIEKKENNYTVCVSRQFF